jgi:hypothetical protein
VSCIGLHTKDNNGTEIIQANSDFQKSIKEHGESLRRLYEQKLSMLKELKNSLLAQAFVGELTA